MWEAKGKRNRQETFYYRKKSVKMCNFTSICLMKTTQNRIEHKERAQNSSNAIEDR